MPKTENDPVRFSIILAKDSPDLAECEIMHQAPMTAVETAGSIAAHKAGMLEGATLRVLFETPGMSLTHVWFKSGFPLPRHSHDTDCLYYILAGSIRIGIEELGTGDAFFVGAEVPYAYTPGEDGVELLEFRNSNNFDIKLLANNAKWWAKAVKTVGRQQAGWSQEQPPSTRSG